MFSDFQNHVIGVPQIAPYFGVKREQHDLRRSRRRRRLRRDADFRRRSDKYKFRTAPLRNIALTPAFFHNGSFTTIEGAIRYHLDAVKSARRYDPERAGIDKDLTRRPMGPIEPVLDRLDPLLVEGIHLSGREIR